MHPARRAMCPAQQAGVDAEVLVAGAVSAGAEEAAAVLAAPQHATRAAAVGSWLARAACSTQPDQLFADFIGQQHVVTLHKDGWPKLTSRIARPTLRRPSTSWGSRFVFLLARGWRLW